jgi:hypothetical protein
MLDGPFDDGLGLRAWVRALLMGALCGRWALVVGHFGRAARPGTVDRRKGVELKVEARIRRCDGAAGSGGGM